MQQVSEALSDVKELYAKLLGQTAPKITPDSYLSFPPGVDPVHHAMLEARHLHQFSEQVDAAKKRGTWIPAADSFMGRDCYVICVDVAGVSRDSLKVLVKEGECIIRGERKPPEDVKELQPLAIERPWGSFQRQFALPAGCLCDDVKARNQDGVLELRIPFEVAKQAPEKTIKVD